MFTASARRSASLASSASRRAAARFSARFSFFRCAFVSSAAAAVAALPLDAAADCGHKDPTQPYYYHTHTSHTAIHTATHGHTRSHTVTHGHTRSHTATNSLIFSHKQSRALRKLTIHRAVKVHELNRGRTADAGFARDCKDCGAPAAAAPTVAAPRPRTTGAFGATSAGDMPTGSDAPAGFTAACSAAHTAGPHVDRGRRCTSTTSTCVCTHPCRLWDVRLHFFGGNVTGSHTARDARSPQPTGPPHNKAVRHPIAHPLTTYRECITTVTTAWYERHALDFFPPCAVSSTRAWDERLAFGVLDSPVADWPAIRVSKDFGECAL
jgi:hypothetical protein